ncbi:MAG TPA: DUF6515 family protein [Steroidobacteraceae bacterium]|nr:DUF6515 family protein [Steroidobacteraceae bacterium]
MKCHRSWTAVAMLCAALGAATGARADSRQDHSRNDHNDRPPPPHGYVLDHRYNHDHYYPPRGYAVNALPSGYYGAHYRGGQYYYHGGVWYRPYGPHFVVVRPPIGIVVPLLPAFYTTVWIGGFPYYYADDTFYTWRPEMRGYEVTEPPDEAAHEATTAPAGDDVFVYPRNGQSEQQQASDRYECHAWAVRETGFDPTQPLGGVDESQVIAKRADYHRAEAACLEARGYSVK